MMETDERTESRGQVPPPISALFLVVFDQKIGYSIALQRTVPGRMSTMCSSSFPPIPPSVSCLASSCMAKSDFVELQSNWKVLLNTSLYHLVFTMSRRI